jgi:hypothetical protein
MNKGQQGILLAFLFRYPNPRLPGTQRMSCWPTFNLTQAS